MRMFGEAGTLTKCRGWRGWYVDKVPRLTLQSGPESTEQCCVHSLGGGLPFTENVDHPGKLRELDSYTIML